MVGSLRKGTIVKASSASKRNLSIWFERSITGQDGRWVARNQMMGFAAYGASKESALRRLHKGITFKINSLGNRLGTEGVLAWLDSRDIRYSFSSEAIADHGEEEMRVSVRF